MWVLKHKYIFIVIAAVLVVGSAIAIIVKGIHPSIEFTGGTLVEYVFDEKPDVDAVNTRIATISDEVTTVQSIGEKGIVVKAKDLNQTQIDTISADLAKYDSSSTLTRSSSVGPSLGAELKKKAVIALVVTVILIILYVAFAFRRVSKPISAWKYGVIVVVTLLHDVIIPFGIIVLMGREFDTLVVVGLLSILGLSVNDTIVVFDRIRENLQLDHSHKEHHQFETTVGTSLTQTVRRSLVTSTALIIVLVILGIFGPEATRTLALILALGTVFGTYSSIFVASPLLVLWEKFSRKA